MSDQSLSGACLEEDRKPSATVTPGKRNTSHGQLVYVRHGKTDHVAQLICTIDVETPPGHVWVRYESTKAEDCVEEDRVTPFDLEEPRTTRRSKLSGHAPTLLASRDCTSAQTPLDTITISDSHVSSPVARGDSVPKKRLFAAKASAANGKRHRKPPPQQPCEEFSLSDSRSASTVSDLTIPSVDSISALSFGSARSLFQDSETGTRRYAHPELAALAARQRPFDRATLREMAKHDNTLKDLPGFSWEPFYDCPALSDDYVHYLNTLPLAEAIGCQQAMKAFAVLASYDQPKTLPPLLVFIDARPQSFGLQTIAKQLNAGVVTMEKECSCTFTRPLKSLSTIEKPYFLCLMIGVERRLLRNELIFRDWVVKTVENNRAAISQACGSIAPDFIYASADGGVEELIDTLTWARKQWGSVHCVIECEGNDCQLLGELSEVAMQHIDLKDGSLWVSDDTFFNRLLRYHGKLEIESHAICQLIALFADSECELTTRRAWPASLTAVAPHLLQEEDQVRESVEEKVFAKKSVGMTKPQKKRRRKKSVKNSMTSNLADCADHEQYVSFLPYLFENDETYNSLSDEDDRRLYREFKQNFYLRVDFWPNMVAQSWDECQVSGAPVNIDGLMKKVTEIRDQSLYSPGNLDATPHVGTPIRKQVNGEYFVGKLVDEGDLRENDDDEEGKLIKVWRVEYQDGDDTEEFDLHDVLKYRQGRNCIPSPLLGRPFRMMEMFCGRAVVTEHFFQRLFKVMSVDSDRKSNATTVMNIHELTCDRIVAVLGGLPDVIWASPTCRSYTRLSGGCHRSNKNPEKTEVALQDNFDLLVIIIVMLVVQKYSPHSIIVIENPVGSMDSCALMLFAKRMLNLRSVQVDYCVFGRDEQKSTVLWTNSSELADRLSMYRCYNLCTHGGRGKHPKSVRGNSLVAHCVIPGPLACVVARHVDAILEKRGVRFSR